MRSAYTVERSVCSVGAATDAGFVVFQDALKLTSVRVVLRKCSSAVMKVLKVASVEPALGGLER